MKNSLFLTLASIFAAVFSQNGAFSAETYSATETGTVRNSAPIPTDAEESVVQSDAVPEEPSDITDEAPAKETKVVETAPLPVKVAEAPKPVEKKAVALAPVPAVAPAPAPNAKEVATKNAATQNQRMGYEKVPNDKRDSIASRLDMISTLVLRYGRAYDYRAYTTSQLKQVLTRLDQEAAKTAKNVAQK